MHCQMSAVFLTSLSSLVYFLFNIGLLFQTYEMKAFNNMSFERFVGKYPFLNGSFIVMLVSMGLASMTVLSSFIRLLSHCCGTEAERRQCQSGWKVFHMVIYVFGKMSAVGALSCYWAGFYLFTLQITNYAIWNGIVSIGLTCLLLGETVYFGLISVDLFSNEGKIAFTPLKEVKQPLLV